MAQKKKITYLRLSITDKCNLKCLYCADADNHRCLPREKILTFEEMVTIVSCLGQRGVRSVRITGGEPLIKRNLSDLIQMLSNIDGIDDLSMTTNGLLLSDHAKSLKESGLHRVNVSLDTLDPDRYRTLTGANGLERVLCGIKQAVACDFSSVKLNVVVLKGMNEDEVCDFIRFGAEHKVVVRFIEYMPLGRVECEPVSTSTIKAAVEKEFGPIKPTSPPLGSGPSEYFKVGNLVKVGFISSISGDPCSCCNRLRLRADGRMYPCLLRSVYVDLKDSLNDDSMNELEVLLDQATALKQAGTADRRNPERFPMCALGG